MTIVNCWFWNAMTIGEESWLFNLASFWASIVTIGGVGIVGLYYLKSRISKKCQKKILLDLIRHVFVNCAIIEIIRLRISEENNCRPADGVLSRFAFLDSDTDLGKFSVSSKNFDEIHSACLSMRNYNVSAVVAERHNSSKDCSYEQRIADLDELFDRGVAVTKKLISLANKMKFNIKVEDIKDKFGDDFEKRKQGMYPNVVLGKTVPLRNKFMNHAYYDEHGLGNLLERNMRVRASTFGFVEV